MGDIEPHGGKPRGVHRSTATYLCKHTARSKEPIPDWIQSIYQHALPGCNAALRGRRCNAPGAVALCPRWRSIDVRAKRATAGFIHFFLRLQCQVSCVTQRSPLPLPVVHCDLPIRHPNDFFSAARANFPRHNMAHSAIALSPSFLLTLFRDSETVTSNSHSSRVATNCYSVVNRSVVALLEEIETCCCNKVGIRRDVDAYSSGRRASEVPAGTCGST